MSRIGVIDTIMTDKEVGRGATVANMDTKAIFLEKVRESNAACQLGDFNRAVTLYTEAIALDRDNHILYSNRSAAYIKMGQFTKALQDAVKAKELNSEWPKAYYREGVALQCLGKHSEALAAFASGLAQDPKSPQLLSGLIEAAMKSPLKVSLEPTYRQLQTMKLDKSPFVIISVIGQELLAQGKYNTAVQVLESALKIGTCSLKLRGSVFSALSSAYWALNSLDKAINYMQQDLGVAKKLGDTTGECRAHGNLGSAYFSKGNYKDALTSNRYQLVLAMKCKDTSAAASALTSLGHVYTAICDYPNALASHKQCVDLMKQMGNELGEARETGNVGAVYLAMGDFDNAVKCHMDHLQIAKRLANKVEEARAYSNLGSSHHYKRNFEQAIVFHNHVLRLATELKDHTIEARAYAGLGHAARCMNDPTAAQNWHEKQLDMALKTRDRVAEGRACSNLGIVYQLRGDHDSALKLHQAHLNICRQLNDRAGMGRAFGNIGNAYSAMGYYEQAIKYHKQELTISKEVNDRSSEASTHGNLAVAYQALNMHDMALAHYHSHLNIARELKDNVGEACALCNLGNCHSSRGEFSQAVPFYENYLMLSQELNDIEGEAKACHFLGYAHYCLGNYKEAIRYYDQDLALARDLEDRLSMGRAYCNLGLAHLAVGNMDNALDCQKYFLAIAQVSKHNQAKFRAMSNIGDVLIKMGNIEEAVKVYQKQLALSKQIHDKGFEANAYGSLGVCHRLLKRYDKSLGFHTQELSILQDISDLSGECRAHGNLGAVHMSLGNNTLALKCFQEQLERAQDLKDRGLEAQAYGNMGITRMNLNHFEEAITNFEAELECLGARSLTSGSSSSRSTAASGRPESAATGQPAQTAGDTSTPVSASNASTAGSTAAGSSSITPTGGNSGAGGAPGHHQHQQQINEEARALGRLGDCYDALGDYNQSVKYHEQFLSLALKSGNLKDQDKAYRGLGLANKNLGNLQEALVCFEKRLVLTHEMSEPISTATAYGELGDIHRLLGNYQQAISCIQHRINMARDSGNEREEGLAVSGLGEVHFTMGDFNTALQYHQAHLSIAQRLTDRPAQIIAFSNIGATLEALKDFDGAKTFQEQNMSIATLLTDRVSKIKALGNLGRIEYLRGNISQSVNFLQQGLQIAEQMLRREDEARIRHRLGLALWLNKDLTGAKDQLDAASQLFEVIRHEVKGSAELKISLYDLQTACYQSLQRILVELDRVEEALIIAERSRNRAFLDMRNGAKAKKGARTKAEAAAQTKNGLEPKSIQEIERLVNRQKASVLYYSLAAGFLYSWLIVPTRGIVKFHQKCLLENEEDADQANLDGRPDNESSRYLLDNYIQSVKESLGIESTSLDPEGQEEEEGTGGVWSNHLEELGDKLNQESDRTGFLRMVNRSSRLNASSYSLSSLFSVGSIGGGSTIGGLNSSSRSGSTRSRARSGWQGPSALRNLYQLLIEPMEDDLPDCYPTELLLVLEGDLFLVPFPVLKGTNSSEYLCERFSLLAIPSLTNLKAKCGRPQPAPGQENGGSSNSIPPVPRLVIGNPKIPSSVTDHWGWNDIPHAEQEANIVSEILQTRTVTGSQATKDLLLSQMSEAESIHLSCHVSWKLSAIIVSPSEFMESRSPGGHSAGGNNPHRYSIHSDTIHEEEDLRSEATTIELPALSEFLLTAADILSLKLTAKLVVISSCYTKNRHGAATSDGLISLSRALLAAGARCVMLCLWPVPDTAVKLIMKAFYSSLLQGARVSRALAEAMTAVQTTKYFQHPANWAGFVLVGQDVKLFDKVALMGQALREIISTPDRCRDTLRVTLHLVEKSLQRINRGYKNAMYTSQKSIENKAGSVNGWRDLLISVGFRFEPSANGTPAAVFFPQSDPGERLTQCSASLQAILALSPTSWHALCRLLESPDSADEIMGMFRQVTSHLAGRDSEAEGADVPVNVRIWRIPGCHELLASLGFDLMEVGRDEVILRTGKNANKRQIHFALQVLVALFDTDEAPRSLNVDSSDSLEDYNDDEQESAESCSPPPPVPPFLAPKKSSIILDGTNGAFSSYARNRGEPDGRQAPGDSPTGSSSPGYAGGQHLPPPPIPPMLHSTTIYHQKGRESDCNFTPSPVESHRGLSRYNPAVYSSGGNDSYGKSPSVYGKQLKHGPSPLSRPESCSSASSAPTTPDWDLSTSGGHSTVVRRNHHHHHAPQHPYGGHVHGHHHHHSHHQHGSAGSLASKLSPGVTDPTYLGLSFKKYMKSGPGSSTGSSGSYDHLAGVGGAGSQPATSTPHAVRSIFTEAGYQSSRSVMIEAGSQNDKLSIRAEVGKASYYKKDPTGRLEPGVTTRLPPTGESNSPKGTIDTRSGAQAKADESDGQQKHKDTANHHDPGSVMRRGDNIDDTSIVQEHILSSQMRRINRELPISEVYHERNLGLGLAPPLSKLIMSNNIAVAQVDHHPEPSGSSVHNSGASSTATSSPRPPSSTENINNFDSLSAINEAAARPSNVRKSRPSVPPKPAVKPPTCMPIIGNVELPWSGGVVNSKYPSGQVDLSPVHSLLSGSRDDGDGRSMTDSQYSGCSPSAPAPQQHHSQHRTSQPVDGLRRAKEQDLLSSRFHYMNVQCRAGSEKGQDLEDRDDDDDDDEDDDDVMQVYQPSTGEHVTFPAKHQVTSIINTHNHIRPSDVAHYINSEFRSDRHAGGYSVKPGLTASSAALSGASSATGNGLGSHGSAGAGFGHGSGLGSRANTKHPHHWAKDKNGRFTYTGNFASDC